MYASPLFPADFLKQTPAPRRQCPLCWDLGMSYVAGLSWSWFCFCSLHHVVETRSQYCFFFESSFEDFWRFFMGKMKEVEHLMGWTLCVCFLTSVIVGLLKQLRRHLAGTSWAQTGRSSNGTTEQLLWKHYILNSLVFLLLQAFLKYCVILGRQDQINT